jgi:ABC-type multidrug transport system ATPase subunit
VRFRELLATLQGERLVVLSTHIITDVEAVATDLALLQHGRLIWTGSPAGLLADGAGCVWSVTVDLPTFERLRTTYRASAAIRRGDVVEARLIARESPLPAAVAVAPTLEEAYLLFADDELPQMAASLV